MEKLFVIKVGGNVIDNKDALDEFLQAFVSVNEKKILIHGGGKIATSIGDRLGIDSKYINGRRITDEATLDLVTMVYGGLVNKNIVAALQAKGVNAIGFTGADGNILRGVKRPVKEIDYGFAGDIEETGVATDLLKQLLESGLAPVFAPLVHNGEGQMLNTNADTIASTLAVAMSAYYEVRLIYCFEKKGILGNVEDENSVVKNLDKKLYQEMLDSRKLFEGILPKIENAFKAIDAGVKEVLIGDAKDLVNNAGKNHFGTLISN